MKPVHAFGFGEGLEGCKSTQSGTGYFTCNDATSYLKFPLSKSDIKFSYTLVQYNYDVITSAKASAYFWPVTNVHKVYASYKENALEMLTIKLEYLQI